MSNFEISDFDIELVKRKKNPELQRGIFPGELEGYLELVAKSLDLHYQTHTRITAHFEIFPSG